MQDLSIIIDELREEMIQTLKGWIQVPSVKTAPEPGAPFGREVRRALDLVLSDAAAMGFETRNFDGYAGDVRMGPLGVDPLAILVHLDVVPDGRRLEVPSFAAEIEDGRMYGRGMSDDKGPAAAALYAMYAMKKAGLPLKREVRLIFGCDEESGWECMKYYMAHCDMPRTGFSPDASYPVINTEKGLLHLSLRAGYASDGLRVKEISVGDRCNVIPGIATALVEGDEALCSRINHLAGDMHIQVEAKMQDGLALLTSTGVPGHAAYPEAARNAIGQLLLMLRALGVTGPLRTLADQVGMEYDGLGLGIRCRMRPAEALPATWASCATMRRTGCTPRWTSAIRSCATDAALTASVRAALEGVEVTVDEQKNPHHVAPNSKLVMALLDAYHEATDRPRECVATGGGTYARVLEEGVAFGGVFPGGAGASGR